jgi:hypothetical protein
MTQSPNDAIHPVVLCVGARVRARCKELGFSQEKLSIALGLALQ